MKRFDIHRDPRFLWGFIVGAAIALVIAIALGRRINPVDLSSEAGIIDAFHRLYVINRFQQTLGATHWLGVTTEQCPLDMWVLQEIIWETRPDVIVETGTAFGGSALYLASIFDLLGHGRVITIDIADLPNKPRNDRITYLHGSSVSDDILIAVHKTIRPGDRVMVFLDSNHHAAHVLKELTLYSRLVSPGAYLVVSDMHLNGHPIVLETHHIGPGPYEAVQEFLAQNDSFVPDHSREKYGLTFSRGGFLRRVK
jgi:cephalosporin hydroxylase